MNRIFEAALEVDQFCRARGWSFCIIGGVAIWSRAGRSERIGPTSNVACGGGASRSAAGAEDL